MPGVVAEPSQRYPAANRLLLRRDHRVDATPLQRAIELAIGVALAAVMVLMAIPVVAATASAWLAIRSS